MSRIADIVSALHSRVPTALELFEDHQQYANDPPPRSLFDVDVLGRPDLAGNASVASFDPARGLVWEGEGEPEVTPPSAETRGAVHETGVEALAYYRSFRRRRSWGIFIREEGINYLLATVFPPPTPAEVLPAYQRAFRLLYLHEYFHFLTDVAAAGAEMLLAESLYGSFLSRHRPWCDTAEGMANAFVLRRFPKPGYRSEIKSFMRSQPRGYKDFAALVSPSGFHEGQHQLAAEFVLRAAARAALPLSHLLFDLERRAVDERDVPVYLVPSPRSTLDALRLIQCIPQLVETERFRRDLSNLPDKVQMTWQVKTKRYLATNVSHRSLNFEKLKGYPNIFSVRIDRGYRATLRPMGGPRWEALRSGPHDRLYAAPM